MYSKTNILLFLLEICLQSDRNLINLTLRTPIPFSNVCKIRPEEILFLFLLSNHLILFFFISAILKVYNEFKISATFDLVLNKGSRKQAIDTPVIIYKDLYKNRIFNYLEYPERLKIYNSKYLLNKANINLM